MTESKKPEVRKDKASESAKCPLVYYKNENDEIHLKVDASVPMPKNIVKRLTGSENEALSSEVMDRAVAAMPRNTRGEDNKNTIMQGLYDYQPRDITEARLCTQATALYSHGMQELAKAENSESSCHVDMHQKNAVKLLRLHLETVKEMVSYRNQGQQRIVIQHVNVENGGQAVVAGSMDRSGEGGK